MKSANHILAANTGIYFCEVLTESKTTDMGSGRVGDRDRGLFSGSGLSLVKWKMVEAAEYECT